MKQHYALSACAQLPIHLLVVTPDDNERRRLKNSIAGSSWKIHEARSMAEALESIAKQNLEIVLTRPDLPDGQWTGLLNYLRSQANPPRVIVFSENADDRFWVQVLDAGGYDVLAAPLDRADLMRAVHIAWISWQRSARSTAMPAGSDGWLASKPARWLPAAARR